ncbi:MAG: hypothetical protein ACF8LK_04105 [Phycisphaerales bacterium JB041]
MLLNIDLPSKKATVHRGGCPHVPSPPGTERKPAGRLGEDGGWFEVASLVVAATIVRRERPELTVDRCSFCQPER